MSAPAPENENVQDPPVDPPHVPDPAVDPEAPAPAAEPAANAHEYVLFNGNLPAATSNVAKEFAKKSPAEQRAHVHATHEFIIDPNAPWLQFNQDVVPQAALIAMPGSHLVKVVYGIGCGSAPIGQTTPVDKKFLCFSGDGGNGLGTPTPMVLPDNVLHSWEIHHMSNNVMLQRLTEKGANFSYPLGRRAIADSIHHMERLIMVPAFLVYDGFDKLLNAAELYERVLSVPNPTEPFWESLKHFLLAVLTGHNANDYKPWVEAQQLYQHVPAEAKLWAARRFKELFPALTTPRTPDRAAAPQSRSSDMAALLDFLQENRVENRHTVTPSTTPEKKDDTDTAISKAGLSILLEMCGLDPAGDISLLPRYFREINQKNTSKSYKKSVITKHLMETFYYDDAEVAPTAPLIAMILDRNWNGKEANVKKPSLAHAMEGLSPFAMQACSDDEIAQINEDYELRHGEGLLLSAKDHKNLRNRAKPIIPEPHDEFLRQLKRFANLYYATFGEQSFGFRFMKVLVDSIRSLSQNARENMSLATKAAILWIVLLQSRQVGIGNFEILLEFAALQRKLNEKTTQISHAELPAGLLSSTNTTSAYGGTGTDDTSKNPLKRPFDAGKEAPTVYFDAQGNTVDLQAFFANYNRNPNSGGGSFKRGRWGDQHSPGHNPGHNQGARGQNFNNWNDKLRTALKEPMDKATRVCNGTTPGFSRILHYCNGPLDAVYGRGSKMCSPNAFFGRCYHGKFCTKQHRKATDAEATKILRVVKPFIDNPEGIKRGVNGWIPAPRTISITDLLDQCHICDENKSKVTNSNPSDSPTIPSPTCPKPIPAIDLTDDTTIVITAPSKHEVTSILKKQPNKRRKRKNRSTPSTKPTKIRFDPKFVAPTPEEQDRIIQQTVHKEDSLPNNVPVKEEIGKCNVKLMKPQKRAEEHPVTPLLHTYAYNGCPVDCGEPWSLDHILAMLERGPHISAKSKEAIIQLRAETLDKQKYGYAKVVKWKDIKDNLPINFKLSPVAMIPHKSRKFRCILDLSFQLFYKGSRLPSVNGQTNKKAVQEAMHQPGSALKRIVATMVDNYEKDVSYLFTKINIKDGYWRMAVSDEDAWNFCYVLPSLQDTTDLDDIEIVVPNSLQMGWSESPPYCSRYHPRTPFWHRFT